MATHALFTNAALLAHFATTGIWYPKCHITQQQQPPQQQQPISSCRTTSEPLNSSAERFAVDALGALLSVRRQQLAEGAAAEPTSRAPAVDAATLLNPRSTVEQVGCSTMSTNLFVADLSWHL